MCQLIKYLYNLTHIYSLIIFLFVSSSLNAEVNILSWGGNYQETQKITLGNNFFEKTGIKINWISWKDYPYIELDQILNNQSNNLPKIDIIDIYINNKNTLNLLNKKCLQKKIYNFSQNKNTSDSYKKILFLEDYIIKPQNECLLGNLLFSWNFAYNSNLFKNNKPASASDFFNTKKFPGKRGIYFGFKPNLELSLIADGVSPKGLYNVIKNQTSAISRSINKIDELCNDPKGGCVFWMSGSEPSNLLKNNEVVMSTGWANRFTKSKIDENLSITQVFNNQIIDYEYFLINNSSKNIKNSISFLEFITTPENELKFLKEIPYSSWRKTTLSYIEDTKSNYDEYTTNILNNIPIKINNFDEQIFINHDYWESEYKKINKIWKKEILNKYN